MPAPLHGDWLIAETLRQRPETLAVFVELRMACPGCPMAPFETLAEAAAEHGLEADVLVARLTTARPGDRS